MVKQWWAPSQGPEPTEYSIGTWDNFWKCDLGHLCPLGTSIPQCPLPVHSPFPPSLAFIATVTSLSCFQSYLSFKKKNSQEWFNGFNTSLRYTFKAIIFQLSSRVVGRGKNGRTQEEHWICWQGPICSTTHRASLAEQTTTLEWRKSTPVLLT